MTATPADASKVQPARESDLRQKLQWLSLFRIVVVAFLTGATALYGPPAAPDLPGLALSSTTLILYAVAGVMCLLSVAYAVALRFIRTEDHLRRLAYVELLGDTLFAATLVVLTGGTSSAFTFIFSLTIVNAAILLYRPGALFTATSCAVLFLLIGLGEFGVAEVAPVKAMRREGVAPIRPLTQVDDASRLGGLAYSLINNIFAFYAIALLASQLSEKLRRTDRQLAAERGQLEDLRALHESIVASIPSGLVTLDHLGRVTFINGIGEALLGRAFAEVRGQDVGVSFPYLRPLDLAPEALGTVFEKPLYDPQGQRRHVQWSISPLAEAKEADSDASPDDTPGGYLLVVNDVSRVREMEEKVRRAESLAGLGKLAASIAHDVRNPLAAISGSIQMLGASLDLQDDERRLMNIVSREADALNRWITDFLTYARPRRGDQLRIDLAVIVDEAVRMLRFDERAIGVDIQVDLASPAYVVADPSALKQVVWNLLANAVEAMPAGHAPRRLEVRLTTTGPAHARQLRLEVADTGCGIPREALQSVFEPFFTTKTGGTGLGLATVYRIVTEHGGTIEVSSQADGPPGEGTRFIVDLPEAAADAAPGLDPSPGLHTRPARASRPFEPALQTALDSPAAGQASSPRPMGS